jgi:hypothetical protein
MLLEIMELESARQKWAAKKGKLKNETFIRDVVENKWRRN